MAGAVQLKVAIGVLRLQGFPGVLIAVGHIIDSFLLEVNLICWKLDLFGQAPWKFLLDLSNKSAIESNFHHIKFTSHKSSVIVPRGDTTMQWNARCKWANSIQSIPSRHSQRTLFLI